MDVRRLRWDNSRVLVLTLLAILALHLAVVPRFRAFLREVTYFVAVAAGDGGWVTRLITLLRHVSFLSAVAACLRSFGWAVFGKVSNYAGLATEATGEAIFTYSRYSSCTLRWPQSVARYILSIDGQAVRSYDTQTCPFVLLYSHGRDVPTRRNSRT